MSNQIQIDLSKAYAGQIAKLRFGGTVRIDRVIKSSRSDAEGNLCNVYLIDPNNSTALYYNNGTEFNEDSDYDIIELKDPIQVQAARIEGEIKGLEWAISIMSNAHDKMCIVQAIEDLKEQLKALQDANN